MWNGPPPSKRPFPQSREGALRAGGPELTGAALTHTVLGVAHITGPCSLGLSATRRQHGKTRLRPGSPGRCQSTWTQPRAALDPPGPRGGRSPGGRAVGQNPDWLRAQGRAGRGGAAGGGIHTWDPAGGARAPRCIGPRRSARITSFLSAPKFLIFKRQRNRLHPHQLKSHTQADDGLRGTGLGDTSPGEALTMRKALPGPRWPTCERTRPDRSPPRGWRPRIPGPVLVLPNPRPRGFGTGGGTPVPGPRAPPSDQAGPEGTR